MKNPVRAPARNRKKIAFISDSAIATDLPLKILSGIARYMQKRRGFTLQPAPFSEISRDSLVGSFDGIIVNLCERNTRSLLAMLKGTGIPVVDTGADVEDPALIRVDVDLAREGTIAAEWFLRRRFRNFAYCGFHGAGVYQFSDTVERGFAATVKKAGYRSLVFKMPKASGGSKRHLRTLRLALEKWIATLPPRTAVMCVHSRRAAFLAEVCLSLGRSVPDDIAIMGRHNDIAVCTCAPVPVTCVDSDLEGLGFAAMRILAEAIERPAAPKLRPVFRIQPHGIVERESTAVYPVDPPYLAKALLLIDDNIEKPLSAAELAKAVGVSSTSLRSAFRNVFGKSLGKYALSVRMREAKRLLTEERVTIKEVASMTGFSSQAYFSAAYHAFHGRPPSQEVVVSR